MKSDRKQTILFIIILLVMSMGIGYAFLTTTLSIDGTSDIDASSWDVHFENVQVLSGSITGTQVITPATISADGQTVSYHIKLNQPGDYYSFKIDAVNDGTLNAIIDDVNIKVNGSENSLPAYLKHSLFYDSTHTPFVNVNEGDFLFAGQSRTMVFGIEYNSDINPDDLPDENSSLNISVEIIYSQYSGNVYLYGDSYKSNSYHFYVSEINGVLPSSVVLHDNPQDALNNSGDNCFIRFMMKNDKAIQYSIGFVYNNYEYYLIGADQGDAYENNKEVLLNAFGEDKCSVSSDSCSCYDNDISYSASNDGSVSVLNNNTERMCSIGITAYNDYFVVCDRFS